MFRRGPSRNSFCVSMSKKKRVPSCSCNSPLEKYEPEEKECPKCGMPLRVKKTQKRRLVTPTKDTKVVEVIKRCNCSNETFVSKKLRKLTPQKSPYSFDLLAQIGRLRFDEHRQVSDIRRHFSKSGINTRHNCAASVQEIFEIFHRRASGEYPTD